MIEYDMGNMGNLLSNVIPMGLPHMWLFTILVALAFTLLIETLVALCFKERKKLVAVMAKMNLVTNPITNIIFIIISLFFSSRSLIQLWVVASILQIGVVIVEAIILKQKMDYSWTKAFLVSALMNASSFAFGLVVWGYYL